MRKRKCVTSIPKRKNKIEYEDDEDDYDTVESSQNIPGLLDDQPLPDSQEQDAARAKMIEDSKRDYFGTIPDASRVNQSLRASISSILKQHQQQQRDPAVAPPNTPQPQPVNQLEAAIEQARRQLPLNIVTDSCEAVHGSPPTSKPFDSDEVYISDSDTAEQLKAAFLHPPPPASRELTK